ncbi:hypothetical protein J1614_002791 [Plenodomus biglobosus]|nr:hypothetical protein J1614_002791 [Plenodomus biglobosus]
MSNSALAAVSAPSLSLLSLPPAGRSHARHPSAITRPFAPVHTAPVSPWCSTQFADSPPAPTPTRFTHA